MLDAPQASSQDFCIFGFRLHIFFLVFLQCQTCQEQCDMSTPITFALQRRSPTLLKDHYTVKESETTENLHPCS